jgi:mannose-6-phosphate isomerase-like protein (cupin superfamily)
MYTENLEAKRATCLRKNGLSNQYLSIVPPNLKKIFLINNNKFITEKLTESDLKIKSNSYYMIINKSNDKINVKYSANPFDHELIYDPYKFEHEKKMNFNPEHFIEKYSIPDNFIDTLSKWYSIKFTYSDFNLIFIKPGLGISIQIHNHRSEKWEIIQGDPIIITGNSVHYFVKNGTQFSNPKGEYHAVINPNKNTDNFVLLKETWEGEFDEKDIKRVFNPNNYE